MSSSAGAALRAGSPTSRRHAHRGRPFGLSVPPGEAGSMSLPASYLVKDQYSGRSVPSGLLPTLASLLLVAAML
jgi:hypothetical protein